MKWLPVGMLGMVFLALLGFFIKNNLVSAPENSNEKTKLFLMEEEESFATQNKNPPRSENLPTVKEVLQNTPVPKAPFGYPSRELICPLRDELLMYVRIQVEYRYSEVKLRDELKLKNPDLDAIVQNVVYSANRSQLNAPWLRSKITEISNQILTKGKIEDIIFKNFKIELRNKQSDTQ